MIEIRRGMGFGAAAIFAAAATLTGFDRAQEGTIDAETAREMLALEAHGGEGWWQASNAQYKANDQQPDFFAMRFELAPGGYAQTGCMWGGRDGERLGPFWHFQSAWDPAEGAVLRYQVTPGGVVGIGHAVKEGDLEVAVQRTFAPGQPEGRIRHLARYPHPDTLVTQSFTDQDGEWVPRRNDTWVWTVPAEGEEPPC